MDFFCSCVCFSSKFASDMKRAQYFFSFALATISFIAARSIQKEGIQNYFEQVADQFQEELGFIDFEHPAQVTYLPMGLQPLTALANIDTLQSVAIGQDSLQLFSFDPSLHTFSPLLSFPEEKKISQIAAFDSTLVLLDQTQQLHFLAAPYQLTTEQTYALSNEDSTKHLICYHPLLKRLLILNSTLLDNGMRRFVCQTFNTNKRQLSQVPLFAFESDELLFEPISMAIQPQSNACYLLSATGEVVVLNQEGVILNRQQLPQSVSQPKLISFAPNGDLLAIDANNLHPVVVRLAWQKMPSEQGTFVH